MVDMKNTSGGQFYFFQARRPTEGPARHSSKALNVQSSLVQFWAAKAQMARTGRVTH